MRVFSEESPKTFPRFRRESVSQKQSIGWLGAFSFSGFCAVHGESPSFVGMCQGKKERIKRGSFRFVQR